MNKINDNIVDIKYQQTGKSSNTSVRDNNLSLKAL